MMKRTWLIVGLTVGIAFLAGCANSVHLGPPEHDTKVLELDKSELTRVEIKMGAGELHVDGGSPKLMEANFEYQGLGSKPQVDYHSTGVRGDIQIHAPEPIQHGER